MHEKIEAAVAEVGKVVYGKEKQIRRFSIP
jgi:hypothetical protein